MRLDYFIVFPNGFEHINGILDTLRLYKDLELVYFRYYEPYDFIAFIEDIYKSDAVPFQHIVGKTKYLHNIGKDCYVGLIKNHKPEEEFVGEGAYRHPQCMLINRFKWQVRELYNPFENGERTENHIIHCSDFEEQVHDFWETTNLHPIGEILSIPNKIFPQLPFHIPHFDNFELKEINVDDLMVNEMTDGENQTIPLKDSIYFKYTQGFKKEYDDYWQELKGKRLWEDKSPGAYDKLIKEFNYKDPILITQNNLVLDGNHRASILLSNGVKKCQAIIIQQ